jgi:hypothetical protein
MRCLRALVPAATLVALSCERWVSPDASAVLSDRFGGQAHRVTEGDGFVSTPSGFAPAARRDVDAIAATEAALKQREGLRLELPRDARVPVRLELRGGFAIQITEDGASGTAAPEGRAIRYTRANGASYWSATASGYEEWLLVRHPEGGAVASWRVAGARLRQAADVVEVLDAHDVARVHVTAPAAFAEGGKSWPVQLKAKGDVLVLEAPATRGWLLIDPFWGATGAMAALRANHTATLLRTGKVLVAGGYDGSSYLTGCELYDPATGTWTATAGAMGTGRGFHTATLLQNGKVLVAGGLTGAGTVTGSSELYDPASNTWAPTTGPLMTARRLHTAVLLTTGKVLVAGGNNGSALTASELFDPSTGAWSNTMTPMTGARDTHTASLLQSGKVLVAGGKNGGAGLDTCELYDPSLNTWSAAGALLTGRVGHIATVLSNGKVLAAGGSNGSGTSLTSAELYTVGTNNWVATAGPLMGARAGHTATLLPNGTVLLAGGNTASQLATTEIFDPSGNIFSSGVAMAAARTSFTATLLPSGRVLVVGGFNGSYVSGSEIYEPAGPAWSAAANSLYALEYQTGTLLPNGKVLVAGGWDGTAGVATAELYTPSSNTWVATNPMTVERWGHTATLLLSGKVLITGGEDATGANVLATTELYDPATGSWSAGGMMTTVRVVHNATLLPNGKVLIAGYAGSAEVYDPTTDSFANTTGAFISGRVRQSQTLLPSGQVLIAGGDCSLCVMPGAIASTTLYDPVSDSFMSVGDLLTARTAHRATLLPSGKVLVEGGNSNPIGGVVITTAEIWDPATGLWTAAASPATARWYHEASLLPSGRVLIAGGTDGTNWFSTAEIYDPLANTWSAAPAMSISRDHHSFILLPNNKVFAISGLENSTVGTINDCTLFDEGRGAQPAWTPTLTGTLPNTAVGGTLSLTGTLFTGVSEGSSGNTQSSPENYPLVWLEHAESEQWLFAAVTAYTTTTATAVLPGTILAGNYWVRVVVGGVPSAALPLVVTPPTANKLAFTVQPTSTPSGASVAPALQVAVQDHNGMTLTSSSASITIAIGTNPGGGTLSGTFTAAAVNGIATFANLSIDRVGTGYTLTASSAAMTAARSSAFNITPAAATQLVFTVQPTNALAGAALAPGVQVSVLDGSGNPVSGSSAPITLALGANPGAGTLAGSTTVAAASGVALFPDLTLNRVGTGYTLVASSPGLSSATSNPFDIAAGAAARLVFAVQPGSANVGASLFPAVQVAVQDASGNTVTTSAASIALALANNPSGATLSGAAPAAALSGVATFASLSVDKIGVGYTLTASGGGLMGATSAPFDVGVAGAAAKVAFVVQPSAVSAGSAIVPAVQVAVQDSGGNLVPGSSAVITLALTNNPTGAAMLTGGAGLAATSGTATFPVASVDLPGMRYALIASSPGLTSATSALFDVGTATGDQPLVIVSAPPSPQTALKCGEPFVYAPTISGPGPATWTMAGVDGAPIPSGLTIDPVTGKVTWLPHSIDVGHVSVLVQVSRGMATATQRLDLSVTCNGGLALEVGFGCGEAGDGFAWALVAWAAALALRSRQRRRD